MYKIFNKSITILLLSATAFVCVASSPELEQATALFKKRKYRAASVSLEKIIPKLKGKDLSKAKLYLAYSFEKIKDLAKAEKVFLELANDPQVWGRHRSEACLALAKISEKKDKKTNKYYEKLLAIPGGHPKHRAKAISYLKAQNTKSSYTQKPSSLKKYIKNTKTRGINSGKTAIFFNARTALPEALWSGNNNNIIANSDYKIPLWTLRFKTANNQIIELDSLDSSNIKYTFNKDSKTPELYITCDAKRNSASAQVKITVSCKAHFIKMKLSAKNLSSELRLWEVDFPKLLLKPLGQSTANKVVYPWRRGRLANIEDFSYSTYQEYPGSSARFQFVAINNPQVRKGIYFACEDNNGNEKIFREFYNPATEKFLLSVTQFPLNRGKAGNNAEFDYSFKLGCFNGDWYDAARIYRTWWQKQPWARRGPLALNKQVSEWLKKAPVFLRFYLRKSRGLGIKENLRGAMAWANFLENRQAPATLYHYSQFEEPETRTKYPVAEYYGYCASPYPGLKGFLQKIKEIGIHPNVFLQSEIFNQDHDVEDTKYLKPTLRTNVNGKPVLYLNERWIACLASQRWQKRYLDMTRHLLDMGFEGLYMDTFGKNKINLECFDTSHGHACGGGNIDNFAQRQMGRKVLALVKGRSKDFYIGGEACVESFPEILDYKLNATNVYKNMLSLERALYGDYILSHGRVIRGNDENNDKKILAMDFIEGVIPGRYYCSGRKSMPKSKSAKAYLKKIIQYTENGVDYLRTGEMLRPLEFKDKIPTVTVVESVREKKIQLPAMKNAVYRSWKDKSIGIVIVNIADKEMTKALKLPDASEWKMSPSAKVYLMSPNGQKTFFAKLDKLKELVVKLPPDGIVFYIVSNH